MCIFENVNEIFFVFVQSLPVEMEVNDLCHICPHHMSSEQQGINQIEGLLVSPPNGRHMRIGLNPRPKLRSKLKRKGHLTMDENDQADIHFSFLRRMKRFFKRKRGSEI